MMSVSARRPRRSGWVYVDSDHEGGWQHLRHNLCVISTVDPIKDKGLEYHVSVTVNEGRGRASDSDMEVVRRHFGMWSATEEHSDKVARHLWLPVRKEGC